MRLVQITRETGNLRLRGLGDSPQAEPRAAVLIPPLPHLGSEFPHTDGGEKVVDRPVTVPEYYATICGALGIDHTMENISREGRPIAVVDGKAAPVEELIKNTATV